MTRRRIWILVFFLLILGSASGWWMLRPGQQSAAKQSQRDVQSESLQQSKKEMAVIGGIRRLASDVDLSDEDRTKTRVMKDDRTAFPYGKTPFLDSNTNPQVAAASEALRDGKHPERLSPFVLPTEFDPTQYKENPKEYLDAVEPGRVWQSAQPGAGVPVLAAISSTSQLMKQGESVRLQVRTKSGQPVTFTSFDLGAFDNKLTSISVAANDQGIAEASFSAPPGTIATVNILAASPVASGNIRFVINVQSAQ